MWVMYEHRIGIREKNVWGGMCAQHQVALRSITSAGGTCVEHYRALRSITWSGFRVRKLSTLWMLARLTKFCVRAILSSKFNT